MIIKIPDIHQLYEFANETTLEYQKQARRHSIVFKYYELERHIQELINTIAAYGTVVDNKGKCTRYIRGRMQYYALRICELEEKKSKRTKRRQVLFDNKLAKIDKVNYAVIPNCTSTKGVMSKFCHDFKHVWYSSNLFLEPKYYEVPILAYYFEDKNDAILFKLKFG